MSGQPSFEGFAPTRLRRFDACLHSAAAELAEPRIRLTQLVGQGIVDIIPHRDGYRMCFSNGVVIHVNRGATFDVAGNPVIEP